MGQGDLSHRPPHNDLIVSSLAIELGINPKLVDQIPYYKYADVLYPRKAIMIYWCIRNNKAFIADPERRCNEYIEKFIAERVANMGANAFFTQFKLAINDKIFELIALRTLAATYQFGKNKMDYLPQHRREEICKYLKLPLNLSCNDAIVKLEEASRLADDEEQILGRLGYLMSWRAMAGNGYEPTVVDEDKIEILNNVPKDNRGLPRDRSILKEWGREDTEQDVMEGPVPGVD